ncbi:MAG: hypothetical protein JKY37_28755 [Nannocystaceae bacterium]|nr:hypothetical protein [Nannocystaceae bacterium]
MMELRQATLVAGGLGLGLLFTGPSCNRSPDADGLGDGETGAQTTGDGGTTAGIGTTSGSADEGTATTGAQPPIYDVGTIPDAPGAMGCGGSGGGGSNEPLYSFIWIANSSEGTVSKIDTVTLEEVGRYLTRPTNGDPSRTSVSLNGDVAVANRNGGLVKFYANPTDCEDANGNGTIDTSTGANDVLAWDDEECRAWFTPFDYSSQRPVAWTPGQWDPTECRYENEKVWTSGANDGGGFGKGGGGGGDAFEGVRVVLVDGGTGEVEHAVKLLDVEPQFYGIYGGAVDGGGNFWGSQLGQGDLVKVDLQTLEYETWPMGSNGYGMTVDSAGYVWVCSYQVGRFDPMTETWETANVNGGGGCMEDGKGTLWLASQPLVGIDTETLAVVATYNLPDYVHGVSIDFQGYVWGVSMNTSAYRVDPMTGEYETVTGLNYPYTYSDMTGFALANAGGWTPAG